MIFTKTIEKIHVYILFIGVAIVPIVFFPFVSDTLTTSKTITLLTIVLLLLITKTLTLIPKGKLEISFNKYDKALLFFTLVYLIAGLVRTPSKMEFLVNPGTGAVVFSGFIIYYFLSSLTLQDRERIKPFLVWSSIVVAIFSTLVRTGFLAKIKFLPEIARSASFSLAGDSITSLVFMMLIIPWVIYDFIFSSKALNKALSGTILVILVLGITASVATTIPTQKNPGIRLPSLSLSWSIAVDTIKENPIWGAGPANYLSSFKKFRPASYNKTNIWNIHFATARNYYLTMITETGLLGILALGYIFILFSKDLNSRIRKIFINWKALNSPLSINFIPLTTLLICLLVFPGTATLLLYFFVLFALINEEESKKTINLTIKALVQPRHTKTNPWVKLPAIVTTFLLGIVLIFSFLVLSRVLAAEILYKKTLDHISANQGKQTYETMQKVIQFNPYFDKYRITFAQINLLLAQYIIKEGNVTSDQRGVVAELSHQAVREAKVAITINPERASNWEILGEVYKSIMSYAQDADVFAIEAFTKAISLDPVNPNLRVALGSVYYSQKNWEKAIDAFKFAVLAKPDYPNAHYDLALAFRQKKEYDNAALEFKEALKLVPEGSEDFQTIKKELENLKVLKDTPLNLPSQNIQ